jgi:hypothetical protein
MFAPPYEMKMIEIVPPLFPYNSIKISKINFNSHLDYYSLRAFIENGFNKASIDHIPNHESLFVYECTFVHNFHMVTFDVTIYSANFYEGFIVEIKHLYGHYTAYEDGIKNLLSILDVKLEQPNEQIYRRKIPMLPLDDTYDHTSFDIEYINSSINLLDSNSNSDTSTIHYGLGCIGSYISEPKKTYLFVDNVGVNVFEHLSKLCIQYSDTESKYDTIIPISCMMIFAEFIKIKGSNYIIIRDLIMPCILKCINNKNQNQHLIRVTLGVIHDICLRYVTYSVDYFKKKENPFYIDNLRSIIETNLYSRDECTSSYATQILKFL